MSDEAAAASEEAAERSTETLGSLLRSARERSDTSVEKIADELRIEEHILHALEEDRLGDIKAAPVFVKGYIKQYGRLLDLDYEELLDAFRRQSGAEDVSLRPNRAIHLRDERQIMVWIIAALAVTLVAVALFVWWLGDDTESLFGQSGDSNDDAPASVAAPVLSRVVTEQSAADVALADVVEDDLSAPDAAVSPEDERAHEPDSVPGASFSSDESQAAPGAVPARDVAAEAEQSSREPETAGGESEQLATLVPVPGSVAMSFEFSAESWFELTDANNRRLHYDLVGAGSSLRFMAVPPARVVIGNATAVSISVESGEYPVPAASLRGNVASFVIDPARTSTED